MSKSTKSAPARSRNKPAAAITTPCFTISGRKPIPCLPGTPRAVDITTAAKRTGWAVPGLAALWEAANPIACNAMSIDGELSAMGTTLAARQVILDQVNAEAPGLCDTCPAEYRRRVIAAAKLVNVGEPAGRRIALELLGASVDAEISEVEKVAIQCLRMRERVDDAIYNINEDQCKPGLESITCFRAREGLRMAKQSLADALTNSLSVRH